MELCAARKNAPTNVKTWLLRTTSGLFKTRILSKEPLGCALRGGAVLVSLLWQSTWQKTTEEGRGSSSRSQDTVSHVGKAWLWAHDVTDHRIAIQEAETRMLEFRRLPSFSLIVYSEFCRVGVPDQWILFRMALIAPPRDASPRCFWIQSNKKNAEYQPHAAILMEVL